MRTVGPRVRAVHQRGGAVVNAEHVQLVVERVGVPVVGAVAVGERLHQVRHRLAHDGVGKSDGGRRRVLLCRHLVNATGYVAVASDDAARGIVDLEDAVGCVVLVGGRRVDDAGDRALVALVSLARSPPARRWSQARSMITFCDWILVRRPLRSRHAQCISLATITKFFSNRTLTFYERLRPAYHFKHFIVKNENELTA